MFRRMIGFLFFLVLGSALLGALLATGVAGLSGVNRWAVIGVIILVLLVIGLVGRRMFGRSWRPVGDLIDATRRLGDGESGVRLQTRRPGPLAAVNSSFNRMAQRLEEEDERRSRLLADLSHELRTPLTVIKGEIEAVMDGLHAPGSLANVLDEVDLMERLLEDLRILALAEAGTLPLHLETVPLERLIDEVLASFASVLETQSIGARMEIGAEMGDIEADPHRLHQVLSNLVANAIRMMPEGGDIVVSAHDSGDTVTITVSDTGSGIPPDRLDQIFDRFVKGGDSKGTGLGLSIARDLIEAHGGEIGALNRPEGGASIVIRLPARAAGHSPGPGDTSTGAA
jgi:signal transduction histidine kinase